MKFIFLTNDFYIKYSSCSEIEQKQNRPYCMLLTKIDEVTWAIPLRSNINHNYVVWSNKINKCGLDLSKAVVVEDSKYIDTTTHVWIRTDEFKILKSKEHIINKKMQNYIRKYVKTYKRQDIKRNKNLCEFSTLQYFHKYIKELNS